MDVMPTALSWIDVVARLACALVAGLAMGFNREEDGKAAGMRTTFIVHA
jgi:uncharacterized membrane protein YhiD involved in acid resistance